MASRDGGLSARAQRVAEMFNGADLDTSVSRNITGVIWGKLLERSLPDSGAEA